jgi:hypothetical protein
MRAGLVLVALVSGDNLLNQMMARDVFFRKINEANAVHAFQDA